MAGEQPEVLEDKFDTDLGNLRKNLAGEQPEVLEEKYDADLGDLPIVISQLLKGIVSRDWAELEMI